MFYLFKTSLLIQVLSWETLNYSSWLEIIKPEPKWRTRTQLRAASAARWVSLAASYVNADAANSANPALNTFTSPTNFAKACYYLESGLLSFSPTFHTHYLLYLLLCKGVSIGFKNTDFNTMLKTFRIIWVKYDGVWFIIN